MGKNKRTHFPGDLKKKKERIIHKKRTLDEAQEESGKLEGRGKLETLEKKRHEEECFLRFEAFEDDTIFTG